MSGISHVSIGVNDVARAKRFYDPLMKLVGLSIRQADDDSVDYGNEALVFSLETPTDGRPATAGNGVHIAFLRYMTLPTLIRPIVAALASVVLLLPLSRAAAAEPDKPKLAVLDIELTGDLGGPEFAAEHAARLSKESDILRQQLAHSGLYQVVDTTPAQALITRLKSQQRYWHDCNGCDLEVGKQLGADQVLVTWVDRVSGLILSLTYEFHGVANGQILGRKSYDFRGDNDAAWTHAISYMVRDLKETKAIQDSAK